MDHSFYLDFLWNNHDWYKITNEMDFIRALLWCAANLVTAFCYVTIPMEIYKWSAQLRSIAVSLVGIGFISFIFLCGMHHFVDVIIMPTAPWWAILFVNVPMAIASLWTYIYIRQNRDLIINLLHEFESLLENLFKKE